MCLLSITKFSDRHALQETKCFGDKARTFLRTSKIPTEQRPGVSERSAIRTEERGPEEDKAWWRRLWDCRNRSATTGWEEKTAPSQSMSVEGKAEGIDSWREWEKQPSRHCDDWKR